ncbi:MAG TPA: matrixin family metalloprotease [Thermoanaerobaculia bacterium]
MRSWIAGVALALFQATMAAGQCTTSYYPQSSGYNSIGIVSRSAHIVSDTIGAGVGYWTQKCGNSGTTFPALKANQSGEMTIGVQLEAGTSTTSSGGCGVFRHQLGPSGRVIGGTIVIFDADVLGQDCEPDRAETIAHEIGHVLGLGHSECAGYIMSYSATRQVQSAECAKADERWTTPEEQYQQDLSRCEMNCPLPCTGNPPVCDTTIDTGGGYQCSFSQCSPLILDLNGDGIHTTSTDDPVSFDLTGDGVPERLGWTNPATEEAFLWLDLDRNGRVDDGRELFGHGTVLENGLRAQDGFEALSQYDQVSLGGNRDGKLSKEDRVWDRLRLWVDADQDGVCTPPETGPIAEYGVLDIALTYSVHETVDPSGNVHRLRSSYGRWIRGDGRPVVARFALHDVFFQSLPPIESDQLNPR